MRYHTTNFGESVRADKIQRYMLFGAWMTMSSVYWGPRDHNGRRYRLIDVQCECQFGMPDMKTIRLSDLCRTKWCPRCSQMDRRRRETEERERVEDLTDVERQLEGLPRTRKRLVEERLERRARRAYRSGVAPKPVTIEYPDD